MNLIFKDCNGYDVLIDTDKVLFVSQDEYPNEEKCIRIHFDNNKYALVNGTIEDYMIKTKKTSSGDYAINKITLKRSKENPHTIKVTTDIDDEGEECHFTHITSADKEPEQFLIALASYLGFTPSELSDLESIKKSGAEVLEELYEIMGGKD